MNNYAVLGLNFGASVEEIKKAYKEIALSCHPDKLVHIKDEDEKNRRIERFKNATRSYEILINKTNEYDENTWDTSNWRDVWQDLFQNETTDIIKDTFVDMANIFIKNNIYSKAYYNPSTNTDKEIIKHEIKLEVSLSEILNNVKKKLRLVLVDIDEPLYVDISCGQYPYIIKEYNDEDDIEHEIIINLKIKPENNYDYIESKNGTIDLITSIDITLLEYIQGCEKNIKYIDGTYCKINIKPFQTDILEIKNKGLKKGSLIVNICVKYFEKEIWNRLKINDKVDMIRILENMYINT